MPIPRWAAFRLRSVLLVVLALGLLLGWVVNRARRHREAVDAVEKFGGWVRYTDEFAIAPVAVARGNNLWSPTWGKLTPGRRPWAPDWLRKPLGDEYFREIAHVSLFVDVRKGMAHSNWNDKGSAAPVLAKLEGQSGLRTLQMGGNQATDDGLKSVGRFPGLEELILFPADEITDAGIAHLGNLKRLRLLLIHKSKLTDEGLRPLGRLTSLEHLMVEGHGFTDAGLAHLKGLTHLKSLSISPSSALTDAGLESLKGMTDLESLDLAGWKVTDRGLDTLRGLKKLQDISLSGTAVTKDGRERFRAAMPGLKTVE